MMCSSRAIAFERVRGPGAHEETSLAGEEDTCSAELGAEAKTEADTSTCTELVKGRQQPFHMTASTLTIK